MRGTTLFPQTKSLSIYVAFMELLDEET